MRHFTLSAVGIAVLCMVPSVVAQAALPTCAATCFASALSNQTACQPTDTACICTNQPLNLAIQGCTMGTCTLKEALSAINTTNTMCGIPTKDRSNALIVTNAVFGGLALIALGIRMLVSIQGSIFGYDDLSAIIAFLFAAPITFGQIVCGALGFGRDTWTVPPEHIYTIMKIVYVDQVSYFISTGASKLCFLLMFLRIFPDQRTRRLVYAGIVATGIFVIAFMVPVILTCRPISAAWTSWDMETPYDHCINQNTFFFVAAGFNIAIDIYIVIIPIPELLKLALSMRKKLMLIAIFSTGVITIIVSVVRLWSLAQYATSSNPMYDNVLSAIFSPLELNVGIIAMCMPAFRRFVARYLPSCFSSWADSSQRKYRESDESESIGALPNARVYPSKRRGERRHPNTLGGSLFETDINKTVDTPVEETRIRDDEVALMELRRKDKRRVKRNLNPASERAPESVYKAQHEGTLPKDWE